MEDPEQSDVSDGTSYKYTEQNPFPSSILFYIAALSGYISPLIPCLPFTSQEQKNQEMVLTGDCF